MADIIVAADDDVRSLFTQLIDPDEEILEKLHLKLLTDISCCAAGDIGIDDGQIAEIDAQHASLSVVFWVAHADDHFVRLLLREDTHARVAFLFRGVDITMIPQLLKRHHVNLFRLRFAFLDAEDIRTLTL